MIVYCKCEDPVMDVEHDAGCDGASVLGCGFCLDTDVPGVVLTGFLGGPR